MKYEVHGQAYKYIGKNWLENTHLVWWVINHVTLCCVFVKVHTVLRVL